ncbi:hypothetical protein SVIOM342S_08920 [Streptomyces violaceorubidus]
MPEQPPYLRIADELRQRIAEHVWEPGYWLPSRAQIGQECGVGENVVRRAQELLISQGVLEGRAGSVTYVAEPRQRVRVVRSSAREQPEGSPFRADMKAVGRQGDWESRTDAQVPAPAEIAARSVAGALCVGRYVPPRRPVTVAVGAGPLLPAVSSSSPGRAARRCRRLSVAAIGSGGHAVGARPRRPSAGRRPPRLQAALVTHIRRTSQRAGTARRDRRTSWCPPRTARSSTRSPSTDRPDSECASV